MISVEESAGSADICVQISFPDADSIELTVRVPLTLTDVGNAGT